MAKAYCPGNVSLVFRIVGSGSERHSLGVGFTVNKGVTVTVRSGDGITFNRNKFDFPTISSVKNNLLNDKKTLIDIQSDLPLGVGFGISGASALATAFALNKEFDLSHSERDLAMIAHNSEVSCGTGLGDVGGQFNGGFMIKSNIGEPLTVENMDVNGKIYYKVFSRLDTKEVISNLEVLERINLGGDKAIKEILSLKKNNLNIQKIIKISKNFAVGSKLPTSDVLNQISSIESRGGNASMIMLGNAVISDVSFEGCSVLNIVKDRVRIV